MPNIEYNYTDEQLDIISDGQLQSNALFDETLKTIAEKLNTEQKKSLIIWLLAKQFSRNIIN